MMQQQHHKPDAMSSIGIVIAVYNGGKFLEQQLESIAFQDYQDWSLYARDDGSQDASLAIVERFSRQDRRIHVLTDAKWNLGARGNFASLT